MIINTLDHIEESIKDTNLERRHRTKCNRWQTLDISPRRYLTFKKMPGVSEHVIVFLKDNAPPRPFDMK